jgi:hypothetical protein
MTALSAARNTAEGIGNVPRNRLSAGVAATTKIYKGTLCGHNASGYMVPMTATPNLTVMGVAECEYDNSSGANAALTANVLDGPHWFVNGDSIGIADIGKLAYAGDDQTVYKANAAGTRPRVGVITAYDATYGVQVNVGCDIGKGATTELSYSLSYSDAWCYIASVTAYSDLTGLLPAGALLLGYDIDNTDWVQGSTNIHADLGTSADDDLYVADIGNVDGGTARTSGAIMKSVATAGAARLTLTTDAGTLGAMTAGAATLKLYVQLP